MSKVKISDELIGKRNPCFIIAEAGVNHNGSIRLAKKLIEAAKEAGADAVKFQTFKAENLTTKTAGLTEYQKKNIGRKESQFELLKKLELSNEDFVELKRYCDKEKIIFLSTPHTEDAVDFLDQLIPFFKVGSGDLTNLPFLKKVAKKRKPIILSTGMASLNEIREAVRAIKKAGNNKIILLHCTTNYPCLLEDVNLRAMLTLKKEFNLPVGYSDHTLGILVPIIAVAMGAKVIEKHFTLDKTLPGPDQILSLDPMELKEMIMAIRKVEVALGSGVKKPVESEKEFQKIIRKSIVAKRDIKKGTAIESEMLIIKRPGTGIPPEKLNEVISRKAKKDIKKDTLIKFEDLK